jgi:predicted nucleic acid-binding protein
VKLLVDTNVALDVLLAREPWAAEGALLFDAIERGDAEGYLAAHAVTTIHYLIERARDRQTAANAVSDLLRVLSVVSLDTHDFQHALALGLADYEDAVHVVAALHIGADYVVTRNAKDYRGATVAVRSAAEVLPLIGI